MADKEFTPTPSGRKVHYTRIFGTNKKEEILTEMWVDMERIDKWTTTTQFHGQWQEVDYKFRWFDKPDDADPPKSRKTKIVKVIDRDLYPRDPETGESDPDEWIPIDVVTRFEVRMGDRVIEYRLVSDKARDDQRTVKWRRIVHYDTNMDDKAAKAAAADPALKKYYIELREYERDGKTQDKGQWAETEIVLKHRDLASGLTGYEAVQTEGLVPAPSSSMGTDQEVEHKFNNQYLLDNSEASELSPHPTDTRHVIDPFQNIVNLQLAPVEEAVLGIAATPVNQADTVTETSVDGLAWKTGSFEGKASNAATGLGKTVVCRGTKYVAFGKPRDGAVCFITAKGFTIQRGVLGEEGTLQWTTVATLPTGGSETQYGARSCSFAGGAFFVSYLTRDDAGRASRMAVSFDGVTFTKGIEPFVGVVAAGNGTGTDGGWDPEPVGGNVAHDKANGVYVTTGKYFRSYWNRQDIGAGDTLPTQFFDENFMSAVSSNGLSWTPKFDTSECSGFPPTNSGGIGSARRQTNVSFGNGRFVAASAFKLNYDFFSAPDFVVFKLAAYAAAVATSTDGINWTNKRLPGSQSSGWVFGVATSSSGGYGNCVRFFKSRKNASGVPGFFVATAFEYGGTDDLKAKQWQSGDGIAWTLVRTDIHKDQWILSTINRSHGTIVYRE